MAASMNNGPGGGVAASSRVPPLQLGDSGLHGDENEPPANFDPKSQKEQTSPRSPKKRERRMRQKAKHANANGDARPLAATVGVTLALAPPALSAALADDAHQNAPPGTRNAPLRS